ncbi:MAG: phage baseplate assembly protein V [Parabacteroides sp.]
MAIYRVKFFRLPEESEIKQQTYATNSEKDKITLTENCPLEPLFTLDFLKTSESKKEIRLAPGITCAVSFVSLRYHKKIYQPGCVEIRLSASDFQENGSSSPTTLWVQTLASYFRGLVMDVEDIQNETIPIATHYSIFQIIPRVIKDSEKTSVDLSLTAYSPDKFLTLDQFSNAFTGKRLVEEMIPSMLNRYQQKATFRRFIRLTRKVQADLNFLTAEMCEKRLQDIINTITDPTLKATYETLLKNFQSQFKGEFLLPYSVQYNESFYDFLVRILNRYGEYFYLEEGVLHVGLPDKASSCTTIKDYMSYALVDNGFQSMDNVRVSHPNALQNPYDIFQSNQEMPYNSEISTEELHVPLKKQEDVSLLQLAKFTTPGLQLAGDSALKALPILIRKASEYLNADSLAKLFIYLGITYGLEVWHHISKTRSETSKFNETYFTTEKNKEESEEEYQRRLLQYNNKQDQFAPYSNLVGMSKEMFHRIELAEQQMSRTQMQVECDGDFQSILLGAFFRLDTDNQAYITTEISGEAKWENSTYTSSLTINGVPVRISTGNQDSHQPSIYWPISADQARIRQSGPQTAYVVANDDPMRLGRVRVKYPWQAITQDENGNFKPDDATPWIRISSPMASEGSGFLFTPSLQDEVLINYENENIEHPYMVGALYNKQNAPQTVPSDFDLIYTGNHSIKSITSNCGHSLSFIEAISGANFVKNVLPPALKTLITFVPPAAPIQDFLDKHTKGAKMLSGGIQMTDQMGFYSVTMSSENRAISIKCPLGQVDISAFTGIKIIAPNGDIKIEGKNVDIIARNKLNIKSGSNITQKESSEKTKWQKFKSFAGETATDLLKSKVKEYLCDLSLVRTILEVFLKPIDGTLRIKSKRYLCIEAGVGTAKIFTPDYYKSMNKKQYKLQSKGKESAARRIRKLDAFVCEYLPALVEAQNHAKEKVAAYKDAWQKFKTDDFPEDVFRRDIHAIESNVRIGEGAEKELPELELEIFKKKELAKKQPMKKKELDAFRQDLLDTLRRGSVERIMERLERKYELEHEQTEKLLGFEEFKTLWDHVECYGDKMETPLNHGLLNRYTLLKIRRKFVNASLPDVMKETGMKRGVDWSEEETDDCWQDMIDSMEYDSEETAGSDGILAKAAAVLADVTGFTGFSDQYVWDTEDHGEILFSNDEQTLHYKNKAIEPYPTQRPTPLEEAKEALRNIKL